MSLILWCGSFSGFRSFSHTHMLISSQLHAQGRPSAYFWSWLNMLQSVLQYGALQILACFASLDLQIDPLWHQETIWLWVGSLFLYCRLEAFSRQKPVLVIGIILFVAQFSEIAVFTCLISSILRTVILYIRSFLFVSNKRVNLVPVNLF